MRDRDIPQSNRRFLIIANPVAGRGRSARLAQEVIALLRTADGVSTEVRWTCRSGDAETIARQALQVGALPSDQPLCVVACGGDGTVQEVVNALMSAQAEGCSGILGLLPAGRCNDFASAFGIRRDPRQIADVLLHGQVRSVDLGRVNERYYCTVAAMGFDAAVSRYVHEMWMPLRGTPSYVYGVLRMLPRFRPPHVRLTFDDGRHDGPLFLAASANTPTYGGKMKIAPEARPDDGLLDVCLVAPMRRLRVLRLLHSAMKGAHVLLPEVRVVRTRTLHIESDLSQEIWADGERVAETPATIEVVPHALEMLAPN